jgi:pyrroloquinoline quinone (PQQ) biosynthesis protein C
MEHFKSPFCESDFASAQTIENQTFFEEMLARARRHPFFAHPFMSTGGRAAVSRDVVSSILTSFYKIVSPFTGLLCTLGGRTPNLRCRFALMDNIFEEMGCGDLESAHPSLYLKMLASIGVTEEAAERAPTLRAIRRINEHLEEVIEHGPFSLACAVLASAEATIPPSFPVLAAMAQDAFPHVDTTFFDRHGPRDEGHSNDAAMLFALSAESSQFGTIEAEVTRDLDHRSELFDEWMVSITSGTARPGSTASQRPQPRSARPPAVRESVPPPG